MPSPIIFLTENLEVAAMKNKIKIYRAMQNLTQDQLAEKIGVSRQTVNAIESNKYLPSLGLALKVAKLFKASVEDVFVYDGNKDENNNS
jgi:putative transcriptional regulator